MKKLLSTMKSLFSWMKLHFWQIKMIWPTELSCLKNTILMKHDNIIIIRMIIPVMKFVPACIFFFVNVDYKIWKNLDLFFQGKMYFSEEKCMIYPYKNVPLLFWRGFTPLVWRVGAPRSLCMLHQGLVVLVRYWLAVLNQILVINHPKFSFPL